MNIFKLKRGAVLRVYKGDDPTVSMPKPPAPVNSEIWQDGNLVGKTTMNKGVQKQESFQRACRCT